MQPSIRPIRCLRTTQQSSSCPLRHRQAVPCECAGALHSAGQHTMAQCSKPPVEQHRHLDSCAATGRMQLRYQQQGSLKGPASLA